MGQPEIVPVNRSQHRAQDLPDRCPVVCYLPGEWGPGHGHWGQKTCRDPAAPAGQATRRSSQRIHRSTFPLMASPSPWTGTAAVTGVICAGTVCPSSLGDSSSVPPSFSTLTVCYLMARPTARLWYWAVLQTMGKHRSRRFRACASQMEIFKGRQWQEGKSFAGHANEKYHFLPLSHQQGGSQIVLPFSLDCCGSQFNCRREVFFPPKSQ